MSDIGVNLAETTRPIEHLLRAIAFRRSHELCVHARTRRQDAGAAISFQRSPSLDSSTGSGRISARGPGESRGNLKFVAQRVAPRGIAPKRRKAWRRYHGRTKR